MDPTCTYVSTAGVRCARRPRGGAIRCSFHKNSLLAIPCGAGCGQLTRSARGYCVSCWNQRRRRCPQEIADTETYATSVRSSIDAANSAARHRFDVARTEAVKEARLASLVEHYPQLFAPPAPAQTPTVVASVPAGLEPFLPPLTTPCSATIDCSDLIAELLA